MNICIVGYGAVGPVHAKALSVIDGVNVYGICDTDRERAVLGAKEYGAKAFFDYSEVLGDKNVDSVHICTPHYLHFDMITRAADAGKKVVAEKPLVMKKSEFDELLSRYSDCDIFPILQNRTNTCIKKLKELTESDGNLGSLKAVKGILTWNRDAKYYRSAEWRGTLKYEGGGALINQAVHTLDLMIYFGGVVRSVCASKSNKSLNGVIEVEDTVDALIDFSNGAVGIFYATNAYASNSPIQLELEYENARFVYIDGKLYKDGEKICTDDSSFIGKTYWGSGHAKILYDYYINGSTLRPSDIKDTMYAMFGIYESAKNNGRRIYI